MTGYRVVSAAIPDSLVDAALRRLNLELRDHYSPEGYERAARSTFFPHARWSPEILALQAAVAVHVEPSPSEVFAEPQLLLRFPDNTDTLLGDPHIDEPPDWADGRGYRTIIGVALTRHQLAVWPRHPSVTPDTPVIVDLAAGDLIALSPETLHAGVPNREGAIRYAVWLRLLAATVEDMPTAA